MENKWIWYQWYNETMNMLCPICNQNNMVMNDQTRTWTRGMLISKMEGGLENKYPNVIPVCYTCQQMMQRVNGGVIDYMMFIGKMSEQEGIELKNKTYQEMISYSQVCPIVKKTGQKCIRMKCGKDIHMCEIHYEDKKRNEMYSTPMDLDIQLQSVNSYYF